MTTVQLTKNGFYLQTPLKTNVPVCRGLTINNNDDDDDDDCGTNRLKMILWQNCAGTPRWQMPQDEWGGDFAFIL